MAWLNLLLNLVNGFMKLFDDILPGILENKKKVFDDPEAERVYSPFMVNRVLSYHPDTLPYCNELNSYHQLDKRPQIDFYLNTIRAKKRPFVKWAKPLKEGNLEAVKLYFGYSDKKASDALRVLTDEQLAFIRVKTKIGE